MYRQTCEYHKQKQMMRSSCCVSPCLCVYRQEQEQDMRQMKYGQADLNGQKADHVQLARQTADRQLRKWAGQDNNELRLSFCLHGR
jgi:hypothetical protein